MSLDILLPRHLAYAKTAQMKSLETAEHNPCSALENGLETLAASGNAARTA